MRMLAEVLAEGQRGIGRDRRVEADEQRLVVINALELVHPIGHGDVVGDAFPARPAQEIPRGPGAPALRHQRRIAVQVDRVGGIADRAKYRALAVVGIRQHRQRLIAVGSNHDMIVGVGLAVAVQLSIVSMPRWANSAVRSG